MVAIVRFVLVLVLVRFIFVSMLHHRVARVDLLWTTLLMWGNSCCRVLLLSCCNGDGTVLAFLLVTRAR